MPVILGAFYEGECIDEICQPDDSDLSPFLENLARMGFDEADVEIREIGRGSDGINHAGDPEDEDLVEKIMEEIEYEDMQFDENFSGIDDGGEGEDDDDIEDYSQAAATA